MNVEFVRESWTEKNETDLERLLTAPELWRYAVKVEKGEIICFGFYGDNERRGTALIEITVSDNKKNLVILELGGSGLSLTKFYLPFFQALAKLEKCDRIILATARKGLMRLAEKSGFRPIYKEYELKI